MTVTQATDAILRMPDISFPDPAALLPFAILCLGCVLFTTLWLLAVSRYACKHGMRR
jgi:hypothetical protein